MNEDQVIERLGGIVQVARLCEVTKSAVSQWKSNGIPKSRLMYLRLIRPDAFTDASKRAAEAAPAEESHV